MAVFPGLDFYFLFQSEFSLFIRIELEQRSNSFHVLVELPTTKLFRAQQYNSFFFRSKQDPKNQLNQSGNKDQLT